MYIFTSIYYCYLSNIRSELIFIAMLIFGPPNSAVLVSQIRALASAILSFVCLLTRSLVCSASTVTRCVHTHTHTLSKLRLVIVNMFLIRPCSELLHYHIRPEFMLVQTNDQARSVVRIAEYTIRMKMSSVIIFTYIKYCQISNFVF